VKAAEKEAALGDKDIQRHADKKAALAAVLANEFVLLKEGTSASAAGKKAVQKLQAVGKEYHFDSTLMHSLPMTAKKVVDTRTEFENMMLHSLQAAIDRNIDAFTYKIAEVEPLQAQKLAAVADTKNNLAQAEAMSAAATEALTAAQAAQKEAAKEVVKTDADLYKIWDDMRVVCEAQDNLGDEVKNFRDNIWTSFEQLKEKEPEPEPVEEPVVEATAEVAMEVAPEVPVEAVAA